MFLANSAEHRRQIQSEQRPETIDKSARGLKTAAIQELQTNVIVRKKIVVFVAKSKNFGIVYKEIGKN